MSVSRKANGSMKPAGAAVLTGNLIAMLGLLTIGYPLASATIKAMLFGWVLMVVAGTELIAGRRFQIATLSSNARTAPGRSNDE